MKAVNMENAMQANVETTSPKSWINLGLESVIKHHVDVMMATVVPPAFQEVVDRFAADLPDGGESFCDRLVNEYAAMIDGLLFRHHNEDVVARYGEQLMHLQEQFSDDLRQLIEDKIFPVAVEDDPIAQLLLSMYGEEASRLRLAELAGKEVVLNSDRPGRLS